MAAAAALGSGVAAPRAAAAASVASDMEQWSTWKRRFLEGGRVIDTGNGGVSHSEGQSYGLLLAEAHDDRMAFERCLDWTLANLRRNGDTLLSWRFRPGATVPVDDPNNATDGDLVFAWALARAAIRWSASGYADIAASMSRDILHRLVSRAQGMTLLLPGARGFDHGSRVVLNPSYYAFAAFPALAALVPDPNWVRLATDGLRLLREARFGPRGLPADWIQISRTGRGLPRLADGKPARFSYDAVRVPLHLVWAGMSAEPAVLAAVDFWSAPGSIPAWADLATGAVPRESASGGVRAVAALAAVASGRESGPVRLPSVAGSRDYYSASLSMLSRLAAREIGLPVAA